MLHSARFSAASFAALALLSQSIFVAGCKPGAAASKMTAPPDLADATGQARCGVKASSAKPLIVEWPAADRAALEARASRGLVAVRYQGCEMEVLTNCTAKGNYEYVGLTAKRETVRIKSADELYANLPVGAAKLEAKLERTGQLTVDMLIVGRQEANRNVFSDYDLDGRCDTATHVVTGLTTGAFSFYAGASAEVGAEARVKQVGIGGGTSHSQETLSSDGKAEACDIAASSDVSPPEGCGALLRVEVVPVDRPKVSAASSSGGGGSSGGIVKKDEPNTGDENLDRKIKIWRGILGSSYLLALGGGLAGLYGGLFLKKKGDEELSAALMDTNNGAGTDKRQGAIRKQQAAGGLVIGGLVGAAAFAALGLYAQVKLQKLKRQSVAFAPAYFRRGGGVAVEVKF